MELGHYGTRELVNTTTSLWAGLQRFVSR